MLIVGLDLGVGSIGWSAILTDENYQPQKILGLGSRIISLTPDESANLDQGKGETVCKQRTAARHIRRGQDRYQQRRRKLHWLLSANGLLSSDNSLNDLSPIDLWQLRADAASSQIPLEELGRVLMHLNQKRGYKHSKSDGGDKDSTEYIAKVNNRFREITQVNETVGQHFARLLKASSVTTKKGKNYTTYRIKGEVFPRKAYEEEFDRIMEVQSTYYPRVLTPEVISALKDAIFYQRPLKSCKHLVSFCEFEQKKFIRKSDGKLVDGGPKVAPHSSPIAQIARIYEAINNIRLVNSHNRRKKDDSLQQTLDLFGDQAPKDARKLQEVYTFSKEERESIFNFLNTHEKMTKTDLFKILHLKDADGFKPDKALGKGIKGNSTYVKIKEVLGDNPSYDHLLECQIEIFDTNQIDEETGEIIQVVSPDIIKQPLYRIWHALYSISDISELSNVLRTKFGINDEAVIDRLTKIDFVKEGYAARSAKYLRRLIPYLAIGLPFSEASAAVGVNHSSSLTKEQNEARQLLTRLPQLQKNSLRQPVIERILNQMINVVNAIIDRWGPIDEIRVELARQLKQSKDERESAYLALNKREKENQKISKLVEEYTKPTRNRLQKYRLWEETGHTCMYCGRPIQASEFLEGNGAEIEHILPRSIFFDNSFSNKAISCRECNQSKGNRTAYDFMASKPKETLDSYIERVERLFAEKRISKTKHDRLMTTAENIPTDFLDRDLRQSQYISRKAREILMEVCRNVHASSGAVTDFLRHVWGYDTILHDLNLPLYESVGLVEEETYEHQGQTHTRSKIKDWSKRLDHRHHAVDALTIALTRQGYIQRLNNLNQERDQMFADVQRQGRQFREGMHLLEEWASTRPHFPYAIVKQAVSEIAVSFKPGKKVTTPGKRYIHTSNGKVLKQQGIFVPRGALHRESIYGRINQIARNQSLKDAFNNSQNIVSPEIKAIVENRIAEFSGDVKAALNSLKKRPLYLGEEKIEKVDLFTQSIVIKYPVDSLTPKDLASIVDNRIRLIVGQRMERFIEGNDKFQANLFKASLESEPLYSDEEGHSIIRSVRCFTGYAPQTMIAVRRDSNNNQIGFAVGGNNHHIAIYKDSNGKMYEHVVSFWTAVMRKRAGLPVIIDDPKNAADQFLNMGESNLTEEIGASLPDPSWKLYLTMEVNNMFILGMSNVDIDEAIKLQDKQTFVNHLYRVQKLSHSEYYFRLNFDTLKDNGKPEQEMKRYYRIKSIRALFDLNPIKVTISLTGEITIKNVSI